MFCLVERCRKQNKYYTNPNQVKEHVRHHSDNHEYIPDWALTYMGQERCHICYTKYFSIETNGLWQHASKTHRERRFEFKNRLGLSDTDHIRQSRNDHGDDNEEDDELEDWDPFADPSRKWVFENDRDRFLKEEIKQREGKKVSSKSHYSSKKQKMSSSSSSSSTSYIPEDPFACGEIVLTPFGEGRIIGSEYREDGCTEMFAVEPTMWELANGQKPVFHVQVSRAKIIHVNFFIYYHIYM